MSHEACRDVFNQRSRQIAELRAEVERLQERGDRWKALHVEAMSLLDRAEQIVAQAVAERDELRAALARLPVAQHCGFGFGDHECYLPAGHGDHAWHGPDLTDDDRR